MKERPILFSAPMVRALLDGSKTQTRRIVKGDQPSGAGTFSISTGFKGGPPVMIETNPCAGGREILWAQKSPYGQPDDTLWVKETFYAWGRWETRFSVKTKRDEWHFVDLTIDAGRQYLYDATTKISTQARNTGSVQWWKRPAIFMPRVASRIGLEVTGVRLERLQECSEADAIAEGIERSRASFMPPAFRLYDKKGPTFWIDPIASYHTLWESINGPGSWDANPWVWVIEFCKASA